MTIPSIKHLVISGGANIGFVYLGLIKKLIENSIIVMEQIETLYCTSVGSIIAVCLSLGYAFQDLEDFFLERPWESVYKIDFHSIVRTIQKGGMFDKSVILETFKPLLLGKELSLDITLHEFYSYCKKDIHFFVTKYSSFELVDLHYKTHANWKLIDAIYASCCLPVLFEPLEHFGDYYIDGGLLKNYPLVQCIKNERCNTNEILGIYHDCSNLNRKLKYSAPFSNESKYRLLEYLFSFVLKLWTFVKHSKTPEEDICPHQIGLLCNTDPQSMLHAFTSKEERHRLFNQGIEQGIPFIESYTNTASDISYNH